MDLYVGNLPYETDEQSLRSHFEPFGAVDRVKLMIDRETGRSRGFAFVGMPDNSEARRAIEELDGREYGGRPMRVNEAKPQEPREPREPRGSGGGYGGGGRGGQRGGGYGGGGGGRRSNY